MRVQKSRRTKLKTQDESDQAYDLHVRLDSRAVFNVVRCLPSNFLYQSLHQILHQTQDDLMDFSLLYCRAYAAFEQTLEQCPNCQRRFLPKPFKTHQKGCTAAKPAKPAGTGLIKFSLTNRLVPGAVAGSMHGKASGYCSSPMTSQV